LGTVVEKPAVKKTGRRLNRGLIYGKSAQYLRFLRNFDTYLNTIGQYMELHSTFPRVPPGTPRHIVNHGVIPQSDLQLFLQSSRLFVGLGFPYDGPGAVEAIANGCPFIQPKFNPPFSKDNNVCLYIQYILDVHTWGTYWTYKHGVHTGRTYIGYILDVHT
jgi:hypothetical protein